VCIQVVYIQAVYIQFWSRDCLVLRQTNPYATITNKTNFLTNETIHACLKKGKEQAQYQQNLKINVLPSLCMHECRPLIIS